MLWFQRWGGTSIPPRYDVHLAEPPRGTAPSICKRRKVPLSEQRQAEAARSYSEGMTLQGVAAKLGTGKDAVRSAVVAYGGTIRSRGSYFRKR